MGWVSAPGTAATPTFEATSTVILDREAGDGSVYQAAAVAKLGAVPARVAEQLDLDRQFVSEAVSVYPRVFGILYITARSNDRSQAEALANLTAQELIIESGGQNSPFRTVEVAQASPVDSSEVEAPRSRPGRAGLLGAFGLILGTGAALAVDRLDNRIRSRQGAETVLGVPVVVEVPPLPRSAQGRLLVDPEAPDFIEAYRRLRTVVDHWRPPADRGSPSRVIVVSSPGTGEGKTTTAAHLAIALAEVGRTVLVISGDLHQPRLHLLFDRPRDPGLADILSRRPGAAALGDLDLATGARGVHLLSSGAPVGHAAPLIDSAGDVVSAARGSYDFVLIDAPSLLMTSDAAGWARHADGVLVVVRAGRTPIRAAGRAGELLARLDIPVVGSVLIGSDTPTFSRVS